ncbi:hypothetical protein AVEN_228390-1 [Araneus ventricosus]|uniref:Uncharacterized protein n=1 Tax=Araneus ventricosus TaxID=182803 RepID=A0A4Y2RJW6_ARAVE|nr:hypothetical protein AVEN_228390-1 [Araneus ventricosus]
MPVDVTSSCCTRGVERSTKGSSGRGRLSKVREKPVYEASWWANQRRAKGVYEAVKPTVIPKSLEISVDLRHSINEDRNDAVLYENLAKKSINCRSLISTICVRSMRQQNPSKTREGEAENKCKRRLYYCKIGTENERYIVKRDRGRLEIERHHHQLKKSQQNGQVWILNYVFDGILLKGAESSATLQRLEPSLHNYVACVYEKNWWVGLVSELNKEGDTIAFIHPHGPSETFYWLERQDECPVPSQHILCVIETPEITTYTGRLYKIGATSKKKIYDRWNTFRESC